MAINIEPLISSHVISSIFDIVELFRCHNTRIFPVGIETAECIPNYLVITYFGAHLSASEMYDHPAAQLNILASGSCIVTIDLDILVTLLDQTTTPVSFDYPLSRVLLSSLLRMCVKLSKIRANKKTTKLSKAAEKRINDYCYEKPPQLFTKNAELWAGILVRDIIRVSAAYNYHLYPFALMDWDRSFNFVQS